MNVRVYDLTKSDGSDLFRHGTFAEAPSVVKNIGIQLPSPPACRTSRSAETQAQSFVDQAVADAPRRRPRSCRARPVTQAPLEPPRAVLTPDPSCDDCSSAPALFPEWRAVAVPMSG